MSYVINCESKIMVGGAVLTADIAASIGADYYSKDALEMVNIIEGFNKWEKRNSENS